MAKPFTEMAFAQRSEEWYAARCGVFTASRAGDAFAKTQKGLWTAKRKDYRTELMLERITGKPTPQGFQSFDMKNGIDREAMNVRHYENVTGTVVRSVGFVLDNEVPVGCSPDGVVGDFEGLVQAKCPKASTHLATLRLERHALESLETSQNPWWAIPDEYKLQLRHELYVTGAGWIDFVSYHPDFPRRLQSVIIRITREDAALADYAALVKEFLEEVEKDSMQIAGWAA